MIDNKNAIMTRRNSLLDEYDLGKLPLEVVEIQFPGRNDINHWQSYNKNATKLIAFCDWRVDSRKVLR